MATMTDRLREEMATKQDLKELRAEMATKKDLAELRAEMVTKKDLANFRQEFKNDVEDAVVQISNAIEKTLTPLTQRVEKIEEHLELIP